MKIMKYLVIMKKLVGVPLTEHCYMCQVVGLGCGLGSCGAGVFPVSIS